MAQRRNEKDDGWRTAPSLDEDRKMLDTLLGIDWQTAAAEAQRLFERTPLAVKDQFEAAVRDAHTGLLRALQSAPVRGEGVATYRTRVKVIAAVLRCIKGHRCPHVGLYLPTYAFPAARLISCADCLPGFRSVFVVSDQRIRDRTDMICDLCLKEATYFTPVVLQVATTVVHGDVCNSCRDGG